MVSTTTAKAVKIVDLLERRGLNFRRDAQGLPMVRKALGHSQPRNVGAGSTTARELQQISEEQCMRHGVIRRGDQIPLTLVHNNQTVTGIIALDMVNGRAIGLQSKAVIIADEGFEGAYTSGISGLGMDMAFRAGVTLRDMEFVMKHPLVIKGTNLFLPLDLLSDGARIHEGSGAPIEVNSMSPIEACAAIEAAVQPVLDAREMGSNAAWWGSIFRLVKQRTGIDMNRQTVEVAPVPAHTIGGLPVDEHGRVVLQSWARWFTGLYAAGPASSSGFHGADVLGGNRLLDALAVSEAAGIHAAGWIESRKFTAASALEEAHGLAEAELSMLGGESDGPVQRLNPLLTRLKEILVSLQSPATVAADYDNAAELLDQLSVKGEQLYCDQTSLISNPNLLEILRTQAAIRMAQAYVQSASLRTESRGLHQRADFTETDAEQLHHNLVFVDGTQATLALRKGPSGNWILSPTAAV